MTTDSPNSDNAVKQAAVPFRLRLDLVIREQSFQGETTWVIKDPIGLKYYRFESYEFFILKMLDGKNSINDILEGFEKRFRSRELTSEELSYFINNLSHSGLLISNIAGQGQRFYEKELLRNQGVILKKLKGIMSLRLKGFDPDPLFNVIYPFVRWMYKPLGVIACVSMAICALLLVVVHHDQLSSRLPSFFDFFAAKNAIWLMIALSIAKVLHEFGHGLTCKHFGGETHEMGVMFLCLTPCLYVNVSDSWMLPNKWHRILVMSAGMYVELLLASIATFVWWFSAPGFLNDLSLRMIMVCSVTTIIFNANPLMRYDGYYILSDYFEIPNLRQQSQTYLKKRLQSALLGIKQGEGRFLPSNHRRLFLAYSVASTAYKWMIAISISWILVRLLEPYDLQSIGYTYAACSLFALVGMPIIQAIEFLKNSERRRMIHRPRLIISSACALAILGIVFVIPFRYDVVADVEVETGTAVSVYASVPGELEAVFVKSGDAVKKGDALARLKNLEFDLRLINLQQRQANYQSQIKNIKGLRFYDSSVQDNLKQLETSLAAVNTQIEMVQGQIDQLTLRSPVDGTVVSSEKKPETKMEFDDLGAWGGSLLAETNRGCQVSVGSELCLVAAQPTKLAEAIVEQHELDFIRVGEPAVVQLNAYPGQLFTGNIESISEIDYDENPKLSQGAASDSTTRLEKQNKFLAQIRIDDVQHPLAIGSQGKTRIRNTRLTVAQRTWRYLNRTFQVSL